jgi:hypothetical protein
VAQGFSESFLQNIKDKQNVGIIKKGEVEVHNKN